MKLTLDSQDRQLETTTFMATEFYTDPKWLPIEQERIFRQTWIYVGHTQRVPDCGSVFVTEVGDISVLIVRDLQGELKAFHNVCPHRASPLQPRSTGTQHCLVCPYHGWVYGLDGHLMGLPGRKYFSDSFDPSAYDLQPIRLELWHSLMFVCLSDTAPSLRDFLGYATELMENYPFSQMQPFLTRETTVECNWKTFNDNGLCDYHVNIAHRQTLKDAQGLSQFYRHKLDEYVNFLIAPVPADYQAEARKILPEPYCSESYTFGIFPNLHIYLLPDGTFWLERIDPLTTDTCQILTEAYTLSKEPMDLEAINAWYDQLFQEDATIAEGVQRGYASGAYRPQEASQLECRILHQQQLIQRHLSPHLSVCPSSRRIINE